MKVIRIPGFYPINWHVWHRIDRTGRRWSEAEKVGQSLLKHRLLVLRNHRKFLR